MIASKDTDQGNDCKQQCSTGCCHASKPNPTSSTTLSLDQEKVDSNASTPRYSGGKKRSTLCLKFSWFLLGIGFLFPYNSVVTAVDFFALIYFQSIDFALGWLLLLPSMIILGITLKYGYWGTIYQRIIGTFLLQAVLTVIIPLVRNVYVVFIGTFCLGCLSAVLQGTLFSLLGFLGSDMMSITQTGIGCSGVLVGIVRILTKTWIPSDIRDSTYLYFLMAFVMVIISIFLWVFLLHPSERVQKAIYQDTMKNKSLHALKQADVVDIVEVDAEQKRVAVLSKMAKSETKRTMNANEAQPMMHDLSSKVNYHACNEQSALNGDHEEEAEAVPLSLWSLFCASWKCQIAVWLNYTLTLSLFPGVMSLMKWSENDDHWFAVIQIFLFNLTDTVGKNLTSYPVILEAWSHTGLLCASIGRLAFIPLFVMCIKPQIFSWQWAIVINALMGMSNGLIGTSGFCLGPLSESVPPHEKGRTAQMLAVALTAGLVVGSSSAFLINYVMDNVL